MTRGNRGFNAISIIIAFGLLSVSVLATSIAFGQGNTAYGSGALPAPKGSYNSAFGWQALGSGGSGSRNVAVGAYALQLTTSGFENVGLGFAALNHNTIGFDNIAIGPYAMYFSTEGASNIAIGQGAMQYDTIGSENHAIGYEALLNNTTGDGNIADGAKALVFNTTGSQNTAIGIQACEGNTIGFGNTAVGAQSLLGNNTGDYNIALGFGAGQSWGGGSNNIAIGNNGIVWDSNTIRIGTAGVHTNTYVAGIDGVAVGGGVEVLINSAGQLGTLVSSKQFKTGIHDIGLMSDRLLRLHPVAFRYRRAAPDGSHPQQFGLIAEEVARVWPDLVQYDKLGQPRAVYYHMLAPLLLNELQREHSKLTVLRAHVEQQSQIIAELRSALEAQSHRIDTLRNAQATESALVNKVLVREMQHRGEHVSVAVTH